MFPELCKNWNSQPPFSQTDSVQISDSVTSVRTEIHKSVAKKLPQKDLSFTHFPFSKMMLTARQLMTCWYKKSYVRVLPLHSIQNDMKPQYWGQNLLTFDKQVKDKICKVYSTLQAKLLQLACQTKWVSVCVCVCACVRACVCAWVCAEMPKLKWDLHVQRYTPCEAVWYRWLRAESWKVTLGYFRLMRSFSFCNTYGHGYDYECSQHHAPCHTLLDMWQ